MNGFIASLSPADGRRIARRSIARLLLAALCVVVAPLATAQNLANAPIISNYARVQPVVARNGMVASQEAHATRVGAAILEAGGNAVDAAVAVSFALAVTHPQAGNLGGGGFMLTYSADRGETLAIDYRETAPAAITRETFLDAQGEADPAKSRDSALGIGVPGTVAGMALALREHGSGRFTLAQLLEPAIALARDGFIVDDDLADSLPRAHRRLSRWPSTAKIFARPDGSPLQRGDRLVQSDLARTLEAIAREGADAFYRGAIAEQIARAVADAGGIMTAADLAAYEPIVRRPVRGSYRGYEMVSMPPPSSGGVHLIQMLNILEGFDLRASGAGSAATLHAMIEAMKPAYADRAEHLGDPKFTRVPVEWLTSKSYAAALREAIDPLRARPAVEIRAGTPPRAGGDNTTHFSIVDRFGNAVSNTTTLNFSYGVGLVAEGTGVLLNNELDDFAAKAGAANAFGLSGGEANAPAPGKRPLSSMTPTIVFKEGKPFLLTGSPGGSRIITTVLQVILNIVDHDMNMAEAVLAPRLHHQWQPDRVLVERGFSPDTLALLRARGHTGEERPTSGSANSILVTPYGLFGAADPRNRGSLALGH